MPLVYILRHGESTWNAEGRWAGHANPPLSPAGREQTLIACKPLADMNFNVVLSSSLVRARETAEIITAQLQLPPPIPLSDFDERHAGQMSGLTSDEIELKFPGVLDAWRQGIPIEIPGGESSARFTNRVIQGFAHLSDYGNQRVLLVSHEGVLRTIAHHLKEPHTKRENLQGRWLELSPLGIRPKY